VRSFERRVPVANFATLTRLIQARAERARIEAAVARMAGPFGLMVLGKIDQGPLVSQLGNVSSSVTVWFGSLSPPSSRWRPLSPRAWTCVGLSAIPLWATWPALALRALAIPAFECLTIAFLFGWLVLARLERTPRSVGSSASVKRIGHLG
jgi:hypothetical protein